MEHNKKRERALSPPSWGRNHLSPLPCPFHHPLSLSLLKHIKVEGGLFPHACAISHPPPPSLFFNLTHYRTEEKKSKSTTPKGAQRGKHEKGSKTEILNVETLGTLFSLEVTN